MPAFRIYRTQLVGHKLILPKSCISEGFRGVLPMWHLIVAVLCSLNVGIATAQESSSTPFQAPSRPIVGGSIPNPSAPPASFGPRGGTEILRHRDLAGKPCLTVQGNARPHIINRNLYDHVITASNACPQRIAIRVCYYRTDNCIPMEIPGGQRKEAVLGTLPATKEFGFEFREKF
jgi:hypothetical protein